MRRRGGIGPTFLPHGRTVAISKDSLDVPVVTSYLVER
jgi:hypothetical protein